jgi:hypothetical protein
MFFIPGRPELAEGQIDDVDDNGVPRRTDEAQDAEEDVDDEDTESEEGVDDEISAPDHGVVPEGGYLDVDPSLNSPMETLLTMQFTERSICNDAFPHTPPKSYQAQHDAMVHILGFAEYDQFSVKRNKKSKKTHAIRKAGAIKASMLG